MSATRNVRAAQDELLAELARGIDSYLEVGVQEGESLRIVLTHGQPRSVVLCDTWGRESGGTGRGNADHILRMLREDRSLFAPELTVLSEDSRTALPRLGGRFDLVHIDGGHSLDVAASDLRHGWRLCSGVMVVHDIEFTEGVWPAFFRFMQDMKDPCDLRCHFGGHGTAVLRRR